MGKTTVIRIGPRGGKIVKESGTQKTYQSAKADALSASKRAIDSGAADDHKAAMHAHESAKGAAENPVDKLFHQTAKWQHEAKSGGAAPADRGAAAAKAEAGKTFLVGGKSRSAADVWKMFGPGTDAKEHMQGTKLVPLVAAIEVMDDAYKAGRLKFDSSHEHYAIRDAIAAHLRSSANA